MSSAQRYIPQVAPVGRAAWLMWGGAGLLMLIWVALIVGAPLLRAQGSAEAAFIIYTGFKPLCHQMQERSFHLAGHPFAVCARCTGLYAGFALAVLCYPLLRSLRRTDTPARLWLLLSVVPVSLDWALGFFGIWENTHLSRALTGGLLGAVAAVYVVPGLMDVVRMDWRKFFGREAAQEVLERPPPERAPLLEKRVAPSDYGSPSSRI